MTRIFPRPRWLMIVFTLALAAGVSGRGGSSDDGEAGRMVPIPAGCFDMGDSFAEKHRDEVPVHQVCIRQDFSMDVHEVTNVQYQACVDAGGCSAPKTSRSYTRASYYGNPVYNNSPVIYVDWNQAAAYCAWANKRLPTEAEWELAARGGLAKQRYPQSNCISCLDASYGRTPTANSCLNFGGLPNDTQPVAHYKPNRYGLYDMTGNVWEWVSDWYSPTYYQESSSTDPTGPDAGIYRVMRGGGWASPPNWLRVSARSKFNPSSASDTIGFRCVAN